MKNNFLIREVKANAKSGQRVIYVGKLFKDGDIVIIKKLNIETEPQLSKVDGSAIPISQNNE
jgi:hypothetical protein